MPSDENKDLLPRRYVVRERGDHRYLQCTEVPNIAVEVKRGASVSPGGAHKAESGTIFLDGAAQGAPFLDTERRVYNLDHHEGCVRSFTLATCEQAFVLVRKGLDLGNNEWTVVANEPDLDTLLAIWVLLNYRRLMAEDGVVRRKIIPLLRLEGAIDAHGLEFVEFCGFPDELRERTTHEMERLRGHEDEVKRGGEWGTIDFLDYTAHLLGLVDELVYSPGDFDDYAEVEELGRVPIVGDRLGVICRSPTGIYEVEKNLRRLHGNRVGVVLLQKDTKTYTVRQVDSFLPIKLDALYDRLNYLDPTVVGGRSENRWGGSADIGGSPRRSGTGLTVAQIEGAMHCVYQPASLLHKLRTLTAAAGVAAAYAAIVFAVALLCGEVRGASTLACLAKLSQRTWFGFVLLALSSVVFLGLPRRDKPSRTLWLSLRPPGGWIWLAFLPVAGALGVIGGAWWHPWRDTLPWPNSLVAVVTLPLAAELLRARIHDLLSATFVVPYAWKRWYTSLPAHATALLFALLTIFLFVPLGQALPGWTVPLTAMASYALGLALSLAKEQWQTLLPATVLHLAAVAAALYLKVT